MHPKRRRPIFLQLRLIAFKPTTAPAPKVIRSVGDNGRLDAPVLRAGISRLRGATAVAANADLGPIELDLGRVPLEGVVDAGDLPGGAGEAGALEERVAGGDGEVAVGGDLLEKAGVHAAWIQLISKSDIVTMAVRVVLAVPYL